MSDHSVIHKKLPETCLVSACLVGLCTRYDAKISYSPACRELLQGKNWVPVCPEQLGGLPTPREAADLSGGDGFAVLSGKARLITRSGGVDVTSQFIKGARQCLIIAQDLKVTTAYLKAKSPSCGLTPQTGVTAALLQQHGIKVIEF